MSIPFKPYLCGPINGCTDVECNDWRAVIKAEFPNAIDPMRRDYRGSEGDDYREIVELDKLDVTRCDCFVANCPKPSVGTSMEILLAWQQGKPVVAIVTDLKTVSPWLRYHATKLVTSPSAAIKWIKDRLI